MHCLVGFINHWLSIFSWILKYEIRVLHSNVFFLKSSCASLTYCCFWLGVTRTQGRALISRRFGHSRWTFWIIRPATIRRSSALYSSPCWRVVWGTGTIWKRRLATRLARSDASLSAPVRFSAGLRMASTGMPGRSVRALV